jgi:hypothetical protein
MNLCFYSFDLFFREQASKIADVSASAPSPAPTGEIKSAAPTKPKKYMKAEEYVVSSHRFAPQVLCFALLTWIFRDDITIPFSDFVQRYFDNSKHLFVYPAAVYRDLMAVLSGMRASTACLCLQWEDADLSLPGDTTVKFSEERMKKLQSMIKSKSLWIEKSATGSRLMSETKNVIKLEDIASVCHDHHISDGRHCSIDATATAVRRHDPSLQ